MLQIDNACIAFGEDILFSEFCMRLNKGETACIAGQSGRGKTSLLNAIMGFVPLRKGKIKVGGILLEPTTIDAIRRHIAWIPQELALPSEWVKEMISLPFALKANRHISFSKEKLFTCFDELGLDKELYQKRVGEISGGQRQRIMIAVAAMLEKPLIIVDDVQYTYEQLSQINVNEIESISILKDASTTAIYGIKGANGVLVVKTRRGKEGKPQINVRLEGGIQTPVRTPDFLNSYNTAILVNEAYENDGMPRLFSKKDIMAFRDHTDPYGHPDVNWYDEIFKKNAFQENVNVDISGGSKRLRYFVSAGYFTQDGMVKDFGTKGNDVNSNYFYRRFNYRTNVDFDVTDNLNMRLDVSSRFMNINEPCNMNATGEIYDFSKMHPYSAPVLNPNGSYAYLRDTEGYKPTLNARLANEGYKRTRRNDNNILYGATWKMDFLTQGLAANFRVAYSSVDENYRQVHRGDYPTYYYNSSTNEYEINPNKKYDYGTYSVTSGTDQATKDVNIQASLNYAHVFNGDHDVNAMFLYNRQSTTNEKDAAVPNNFEGYTLTMGYKYKGKYLIDLNMAYNGTDRFGKNNRFGFFPAFSLAWNIAEEPIIKKNLKWMNMFKLRYSYGKVGSDNIGTRFPYLELFESRNPYNWGDYNTPNVDNGQIYKQISSSGVTWEIATKHDIGVDFSLWDDRFTGTVDYFHETRDGIFMQRQSLPGTLGLSYLTPSANVGKVRSTGFDGNVAFKQDIGNVSLTVRGNFTYSNNKILAADEANSAYPYIRDTGYRVNQAKGLIALGLFKDYDDIRNSPQQTEWGTVMPGDIKYKDVNSDGVINDSDRVPIGSTTRPNLIYGFGMSATWKGFDVNLHFQGAGKSSFFIDGFGVRPFSGGDWGNILTDVVGNYWSLGTNENPDAKYPRLTWQNNSNNNRESTYWLRDGSYLRLKTVEVGYTLPKNISRAILMNNVRIFFIGTNLLTFSKFKLWDPEMGSSNGQQYPLSKILTLGLTVNI